MKSKTLNGFGGFTWVGYSVKNNKKLRRCYRCGFHRITVRFSVDKFRMREKKVFHCECENCGFRSRSMYGQTYAEKEWNGEFYKKVVWRVRPWVSARK